MNRASVHDQKGEAALSKLLTTPLNRYDVVKLLALDTYPKLMDLLFPIKRKEMARKIVEAILDGDFIVDSVENVTRLMSFVAPLMKDIESGPQERDGRQFPEEAEELEDIEEEQTLIARLLHNLKSPNPNEQFTILKDLTQNIEEGGFHRMKYTLPSMIFNGLKLVRELGNNFVFSLRFILCFLIAKVSSSPDNQTTFDSVFEWLLHLCGLIVEVPLPMMALRCLLQCGYAASEEAHLEHLSYDCFELACILFEESLGNSTEKGSALQAIIGTLHRCHVFGDENRAALNQALLGYCSQLLTKDEQCKAICLYSRLFWQQELPPKEDEEENKEDSKVVVIRDADNVMKAMKRGINLASRAQRTADILRRLGRNIETVRNQLSISVQDCMLTG